MIRASALPGGTPPIPPRRASALVALSFLVSACGAGKIVGGGLHAIGVVDEKTADAIGASDNLTNALKPIGFEEEKSIGGAVALMAVSRFGGLDKDENAQRYVRTVGLAVASYSDRASIPYYFGVLASKEPNAFACPGGYIFLTRGLLDQLKDEAELAGVLGHEIAHVTEKHALAVIRRSKIIAGTAEVTAAYLDKNPKAFDELVNETSKVLFEKGLDKGKEADADRIGTDYAHRLGYEAGGLRDYLKRLEAAEEAKKDGKRALSTHPPAKARVKDLEALLSKYRSGGVRLADRFRQRMAGS